MERTRVSLPISALALALVLFGTSCTKEEVVAPASAAHGTLKSSTDPSPTFNGSTDGSVDPKVDPNPDPTTISDDGDDQGDRERGRGKRGR